MKALSHACMEANCKLEIEYIESSDLEYNTDLGLTDDKYMAAWAKLNSIEGVICPGGFGDRGIEGKSLSAKHCREKRKPYLGICLGMQTALIEFARNVLQLEDAGSEEFTLDAKHKVIVPMPQHVTKQLGGTMRLGEQVSIIRDKNSITSKLYDKAPAIYERFRHRYEVNSEYVSLFESKGFKFVAGAEENDRMEVAELDNHPFFVCCQFHPEFLSRPMHPAPLFLGFVLAVLGTLEDRLEKNNGCLFSGSSYLQAFNSLS